jgi:hypothetical protein
MSAIGIRAHDLPERLKRYDGGHVILKRIALTQPQLPRSAGLSGF